MTDIIAKLQAATEPSRELDAEIAQYIGIRSRSRRTRSGVNKGREWLVDNHGGIETWAHHPPHYTASIDAVLALMPEDYDWSVGYIRENGAVMAHIMRRATDAERIKFAFSPGETGYISFSGKSPVPAIALLIALLQAGSETP